MAAYGPIAFRRLRRFWCPSDIARKAAALVQSGARTRPCEPRVAALIVGAGPAFAVDETKDAAAYRFGIAFDARHGARGHTHVFRCQ